VEFSDLARRRRMVRSFDGTAVPGDLMAAWCELALSAPTAGNSAGVQFVVIESTRVAHYFEAATDESWRLNARRADGLLRTGGVVLALSNPDLYTERYSETDKAQSGLGDQDAWPIPYWHTDAAMATMQLLLAAEDDNWATCFWGNFRHEAEILSLAGVAAPWRLFGSILIGRPDGNDVRSPSLDRDVPSRTSRVLRLS
jgi:nitroreductase